MWSYHPMIPTYWWLLCQTISYVTTSKEPWTWVNLTSLPPFCRWGHWSSGCIKCYDQGHSANKRQDLDSVWGVYFERAKAFLLSCPVSSSFSVLAVRTLLCALASAGLRGAAWRLGVLWGSPEYSASLLWVSCLHPGNEQVLGTLPSLLTLGQLLDCEVSSKLRATAHRVGTWRPPC